MDSGPFTIFGSHTPGGSYILFIRLSSPQRITFGRFMKGMPIALPEGTYLYVGSALGGRGRHNPLASRLVRHATRTGSKKNHEIRDTVEALFCESPGIQLREKGYRQKKLHWHIDYLLDLASAEITHIVIIRHSDKLERILWELLRDLEDIEVPARGLGARDTRDSTHLVRLVNPERVLAVLRDRIPLILSQELSKNA
jgi:Uri superfamily endonuclease